MDGKKLKFLLALLLVTGVLFTAVFLPIEKTHGKDLLTNDGGKLSPSIDQDFLRELNIKIAIVAVIPLVLLVFIAFVSGANGKERTKMLVFWSMVVVIIAPTLFFIGSTLYLNLSSITKGPVHWHADFKIITCGQEIAPVDIKGLSNKLGSNLLHEHEDRRIHIEGVVTVAGDVSLGKFFEVQGGRLSQSEFTIPTNDGLRTVKNGDLCDNEQPGKWQVFLYRTGGGTTAQQEKLDDFAGYVPSPYVSVPPGDCIILEFGPEKDRTDQLCDFYRLEINKGNLKIL